MHWITIKDNMLWHGLWYKAMHAIYALDMTE